MAKNKKFITDAVVSLAIILICAFSASLLARLNWSFDLASHFVFQYLIGALILTPALYILHKKKLALIVLFIGLGSAVEISLYIYRHYQPPTAITTDTQTFSVAQYNRLVSHQNHDAVIDWLRLSSADVVVLQEANHSLAEAVKALRQEFPYQLHEPRAHAFGMIILSKYAFTSSSSLKVHDTFVLRFTVKKYNDRPVTLYALHAFVPTSAARDEELMTTSNLIAQDTDKNIIFMGDWNITPFSPVFDKILDTTKLQHRDTSLYPVTTWPSFFKVPVFQIPIDQILFSNGLLMMKKERGPHMGSDHYPIMATFTFSP